MQLGPSLLGGELPIDRGSLSVAAAFIGGYLLSERRDIRKTAIKTLTVQDTEFDFGHVQPTAMFGGVVELQFLANTAGFGGREGVIERGRTMGIELIEYHTNDLGLRIPFIDQPLHLVRKVGLGPAFSDHHMPPACLRFTHHKEVGSAVALVFIVNAGWL